MTHPNLDPKKYDLTADEVRNLLNYDPSSGTLVWRNTAARPPNWNALYAGKDAGYINTASRLIVAVFYAGKKRRYQASMIVWLWMTGEWPSDEIDHRDMDKANIRWNNLRLATPSQNKCNRGARPGTLTGVKGVWLDRSGHRYTAQIQLHGVKRRLGRFSTIEEAGAAYAAAAAELHGEFARVA